MDDAPESPAAQLARLRWKGSTKAQRSAEMSRVANARTAALTPEQRKAIATNASKAATKARKAKAAAKKKAEKSLRRKAKKDNT